jgi:hypothetical protein
MFKTFLAFLGQEPPIPSGGDELPSVMPSLVLLIVVTLAVAGIVAWNTCTRLKNYGKEKTKDSTLS